MRARIRRELLLLAAGCGAALLPWFGAAHAQECAVGFEDAEFFIEVNATDGDAGVQLMLDGEGWNDLEMVDPLQSLILEISASDGPGGSIVAQGLTELFFESAEPSFEAQTLQELFDLFPEGEYELTGVTTEGEEICGTAEFTHDIPAAPEPTVKVKGNGKKVTICWPPVEDPFEDPNGAAVGEEIEIEMYRVVVEALDEEGEGLQTLDVELPSTALCLSIPREFLRLSEAGEFSFEVIATEESGNQTIFADEFGVSGEEGEQAAEGSRRHRSRGHDD